MDDSKGKCPYITSQFEDKKHTKSLKNEIETFLNTLNEKTENFPENTSPAMMQECGNKKCYNNDNETDASINTKNQGENISRR